MTRLIAATLALALSTTALAAQDETPEAVTAWLESPETPIDAATVALDDFVWIARSVVVFADSPNDPAFASQMELLAERSDELAMRDVVVIFDTAPQDPSPLRTRLRPRGFMMTLIGKDDQVKLRKPRPYDVRELSRSIDKMPMRQREIAERRGATGD
ncbi:DUF4174 domain-containing protein [Salipiger sp. IMCC34102]|nr:DUF4174 domain-containing protein [Salipiger sp. IMCC34102]